MSGKKVQLYVCLYRVSNTPGDPRNVLELFFSSWKSWESTGNLLSLLEIFWFSLRVCAFVINISYNSCILENVGQTRKWANAQRDRHPAEYR